MGTSSSNSLHPTNAKTQSSGAPCDPPVVSVSYPVFCDLQGDRPAASPPQGSLRMHPSTMRVASSKPIILSWTSDKFVLSAGKTPEVTVSSRRVLFLITEQPLSAILT